MDLLHDALELLAPVAVVAEHVVTGAPRREYDGRPGHGQVPRRQHGFPQRTRLSHQHSAPHIDPLLARLLGQLGAGLPDGHQHFHPPGSRLGDCRQVQVLVVAAGYQQKRPAEALQRRHHGFRRRAVGVVVEAHPLPFPHGLEPVSQPHEGGQGLPHRGRTGPQAQRPGRRGHCVLHVVEARQRHLVGGADDLVPSALAPHEAIAHQDHPVAQSPRARVRVEKHRPAGHAPAYPAAQHRAAPVQHGEV